MHDPASSLLNVHRASRKCTAWALSWQGQMGNDLTLSGDSSAKASSTATFVPAPADFLKPFFCTTSALFALMPGGADVCAISRLLRLQLNGVSANNEVPVL